MQHVHTIIQPKWVLTVDQNNTILENHAVVVDCGNIVDILPQEKVAERYTANNYYFLDGHALAPGLINAHTHAAMNLFRGVANDLPLMTWLEEHMWPAERKAVSEQFVRDGIQHAMAEMLRCGVTCFNDHYFYNEAAAEEVHAAKMRAFLSECIFHFGTPWSPTPDVGFERTHALVDKVRSMPLVGATVGPHSPYGTSPEIMGRVKEVADQFGLQIHIHLHETQFEVDEYVKAHGQTPLMQYHKLGITGPQLMAVHMTQVAEEEFEALVESKTNVVHCPESNMKLASGICPVQELLDRGVNVALATDGAASNNDLDMIGEMRTAAFLGKLASLNPVHVRASDVLRMATINGAKALGIDQEVGSIEKGKSADLFAIDLGRIETQPCFDPVAQIVYAASRDQVTHTWVAGKALLQDRQLTTLDEDRILSNCQVWHEKLNSL